MKAVFLCFVTLLLVSLALADNAALKAIKDKIESSKTIDATSIGAKLSGKISISIHVSKFVCTNITATLTTDSLTVTANTRFWDKDLYTQFYFYYQGNQLEVALQFSLSEPLSDIYSVIAKKTAPDFLRGLKGTGEVQFKLNTAGDGIVPQGITIGGSVLITNGTLLEAAQFFHSGVKSLKVDARVFIPVYTNPTYVSLQLEEIGGFYLKKNIEVNNFMIKVQSTTSVTISLSFDADVSVAGPDKTTDHLDFALSAVFASGQKTLTFAGTMQGKWVDPFGIKWLTVTSADAKVEIGAQHHLSFSVSGDATVSWSSSTVTAGISIGGAGFDDLLFYIENIPLVDNSLDKVYSDVLGGKVPKDFASLDVVGKATLAIATYDTPQTSEGFTIDVDVKISEQNPLLKAVQVLKKGANSDTFTYDFALFVPIFTDAADINLSLKEAGAFAVSKYIECESFSVAIDISEESSIKISADLEVTAAQNQVLDFTVATDWEESSSLSFSGSLTNKWVHPFGYKWMTLDSASVDLVLGEEGLTSLTLQGQMAFTFSAVKTATVMVEIGGDQLQNVLFAVTNVQFDELTLGLLWEDITGSTNIPDSFVSINPKGTASVWISTYDAPTAAEGFTLKADVSLRDGAGDVYQAASVFSQNPSLLTFDLTLIIPIFTDPADVTFDLSETGKIALTKDIEILGYHLDLAISDHTTINIGTTLSVTLKENPSPIAFSVDAIWTEGTSITLTGALVGDWDHPFGADWMDITAAQVNLVVGIPASVSSFSISGSAALTFKNDKATASFVVSTADDFTENSFSATVKNIWTLNDIAESIIGKTPSHYLEDLETTAAGSLTLAISTYDGTYLEGVTIEVSGKVTGALASELEKDAYWWKKDLKDLSFSVALNVPIFSADPADIDLSLTWSEQIELTKHLWFESVSFSIDMLPFAVSLAGKVKAQFAKNPVLYFEVGGEFKTNEVLLYGAMMGMWDNPFGIKGFDLGDVILQIGFSPSMCAVDACISDLGAGAKMVIGSDTIKFDGNVAAPDFWDMYLAGSIEGGNDLILSVLGVVEEWNKINPAMKISTADIPPTWGLNDVGFYFAPADGTLGPIHYTAGFGITGGITILDMKLYLSINCTDAAGLSCNFAFDVNISKQTFTAMIKKELGIMYPGNSTVLDIFSLKSVTLNQWSQKHVAVGTNPHWAIDIVVLDKEHHLDFHVEQYELASTFHEFFKKWMAHIFGGLDHHTSNVISA